MLVNMVKVNHFTGSHGQPSQGFLPFCGGAYGGGCFEIGNLQVGDIIWFRHSSSRKSDVEKDVVSYYKIHGKASDLVRSTTV